jgi:hypothetical protein
MAYKLWEYYIAYYTSATAATGYYYVILSIAVLVRQLKWNGWKVDFKIPRKTKFRPFVNDFKRELNELQRSYILIISAIRNNWTVIPRLFQHLILPFHSRRNVSSHLLLGLSLNNRAISSTYGAIYIRRTGSVATAEKCPPATRLLALIQNGSLI